MAETTENSVSISVTEVEIVAAPKIKQQSWSSVGCLNPSCREKFCNFMLIAIGCLLLLFAIFVVVSFFVCFSTICPVEVMQIVEPWFFVVIAFAIMAIILKCCCKWNN